MLKSDVTHPQVAPHLEHFLAPWCAALRLLNDGVEKEHAFQGLCCTVRHNPQVRALFLRLVKHQRIMPLSKETAKEHAFQGLCCTVRHNPPGACSVYPPCKISAHCAPCKRDRKGARLPGPVGLRYKT